jgi:beta-galactosidase/beta-glucuronidase
VRNVAWDGERGLVLNEQNVKMRGACNHESFTGVGAALPERIDLLRVQQMRGVGMNAWRTSHNPPEPALLHIADRLGILVLDENRVLATNTNCEGCGNVPGYSGDPAADTGALAVRDRNHASVIWYSLCNEAGCGNGSLLNNDLVEQCKTNMYAADGSRAVGANMGWISPIWPGTPMSTALDVMGCSHCGAQDMLKYHEKEPTKPLVMTECCSCENQRGEDADQPHNSTLVHYNDEVAGCLADQVANSDHLEYVGGTFVWTLHDYMGEPGSWPHVSSSFGAIDLAGFQKPPAWWYRSVWLSNVSAAGKYANTPLPPSRPPLTLENPS